MNEEMLRGQVAVANQLLSEQNVSGSVTIIDREENRLVFCPVGVAFKGCNMAAIPMDSEELDVPGYPADLRLHLALYRQYPQSACAVHAYPRKASAYADAGKKIEVYGKRFAERFPGAVECVETGGSAEELGEALRALPCAEDMAAEGAALIHHDGALIWGTTAINALERTADLEALAEASAAVEELGNAEPLPRELVRKVYEARRAAEKSSSQGRPDLPVTEEQRKKINMELLIYFDHVCRANDIHYSVTGGTLLGAVRHGGLIPWDDDVDVFMPRPEYEKLAAVFPDGERFVYMDQSKDPDYNFPYARILDTRTYISESPGSRNAGAGLFLDICPVDGLPKNPLLRKIHMKHMRLLVRFRRATMFNPNAVPFKKRGPLFRLMKLMVRKMTTHHFWNRRMDKVMKRYPFDRSGYVGNFSSQYGDRELLKRSDFDSYFDISIEGLHFMACRGYEEYLKNIYGAYMEMPPIENRKGHHVYTAYWIE